MKIVEIYTDGSCTPNPGPGTCAYAIIEKDTVVRQEIFSSEDATNNIMEMTAVVKALEYCLRHHKDSRIYIHTDSQYIQLGISEWLPKWKANNWKTSAKKPVSNKELWNQIDDLNSQLKVSFQWVRGHSDNKWNNYVDKLCKTK
jgi:ribonuclease HI